jgi:hypothetical protein
MKKEKDPLLTVLPIHIEYDFLRLKKLVDFARIIDDMHGIIVAPFNNTFLLPEFSETPLNNILEISHMSTGNSIIMKLKEGWLPTFQIKKTDSVLKIPTLLGIPAILGYVLISAIENSAPARNQDVEKRRKVLESRLMENDLSKAVFKNALKGEVKDHLQNHGLMLMQEANANGEIRKFHIYDIDILAGMKDKRDTHRKPVNISAEVQSSDGSFYGKVIDISRTGICIKTLGGKLPVSTQKELEILLPNYKGKARFRHRNFASELGQVFEFSEPLTKEQLESIISLSA